MILTILMWRRLDDSYDMNLLKESPGDLVPWRPIYKDPEVAPLPRILVFAMVATGCLNVFVRTLKGSPSIYKDREVAHTAPNFGFRDCNHEMRILKVVIVRT
jgi:hypothetical protein